MYCSCTDSGVLSVDAVSVVDYDSNLLFWVDAKLHHISCSDLLGNNQRVIMTSYRHLRHPFAITVFEVQARIFLLIDETVCSRFSVSLVTGREAAEIKQNRLFSG